ncbi:hypothetical protein [Nonomuraea aridisoli]|uniref:hypothetical protein n=1 Tax=Nonomuraea aridisoli TaxID=2070368 RepID=UPI0015E87D6A|nr:hypothetical protein [Nonomuraea aridisoli]
MGRHAKPHNPKEQQPELKEGSAADERHVSRGRHAKGRRPCASAGEKTAPSPASAG